MLGPVTETCIHLLSAVLPVEWVETLGEVLAQHGSDDGGARSASRDATDASQIQYLSRILCLLLNDNDSQTVADGDVGMMLVSNYRANTSIDALRGSGIAYNVMHCMHAVHENAMVSNTSHEITVAVARLCIDVAMVCRLPAYVEYYVMYHPELPISVLECSRMFQNVPDLVPWSFTNWYVNLVKTGIASELVLPQIDGINLCCDWTLLMAQLSVALMSFVNTSDMQLLTNTIRSSRLSDCSIRHLPPWLSAPLECVLSMIRESPPDKLTSRAYGIIGRRDLAAYLRDDDDGEMCDITPWGHDDEHTCIDTSSVINSSDTFVRIGKLLTSPLVIPGRRLPENVTENIKQSGDDLLDIGGDSEGTEAPADGRLVAMMYPRDLRVMCARELLVTSIPPQVVVVKKQEWSDHDYAAEQQVVLANMLTLIGSRVIGRGALGYRCTRSIGT